MREINLRDEKITDIDDLCRGLMNGALESYRQGETSPIEAVLLFHGWAGSKIKVTVTIEDVL